MSYRSWADSPGYQLILGGQRGGGPRFGGNETAAQAAQGLVERWRESDSGYFCNMMTGDFNVIGVGVYYCAATDEWWGTQNFVSVAP